MIGSPKHNYNQREINEVLDRMLENGDICIAGQNAAGENLLQPSAKAVTRSTCEVLQTAVSQADQLGRNFTYTEQRELLTHVRQLYQALASSEETEA
jgi:hypothetical protein